MQYLSPEPLPLKAPSVHYVLLPAVFPPLQEAGHYKRQFPQVPFPCGFHRFIKKGKCIPGKTDELKCYHLRFLFIHQTRLHPFAFFVQTIVVFSIISFIFCIKLDFAGYSVINYLLFLHFFLIIFLKSKDLAAENTWQTLFHSQDLQS